MWEKLHILGNKRFIQGLALGSILAAVPPVWSAYNDNTAICTLNAGELEDIVEDALEDVLATLGPTDPADAPSSSLNNLTELGASGPLEKEVSEDEDEDH